MHEFVIIIIRVKHAGIITLLMIIIILWGRGYQHEKNTERPAESGRTVYRTGNGGA
jgi:hypothetical protein